MFLVAGTRVNRSLKFSSQTKDKLVSSEVRPVIESSVSEQLQQWFEEHPQEIIPYDAVLQVLGKFVARKLPEELSQNEKIRHRKLNQ